MQLQPPDPVQVQSPLQVPLPFAFEHAVAGSTTSSSTTPSQSSSCPLHTSSAGTLAEHAVKPPPVGLQVCAPAQVPNVLVCVQARVSPRSSLFKHSHEFVLGKQPLRFEPGIDLHVKPASHWFAGRPLRLPAAQSSTHALPPSSSTQALPGTTQFASWVHGRHAACTMGKHVEGPAW